jgi:hypothetical protein
MKFFSEIHSGDVNKHSGPDRKLHPFHPGTDIHIASESLFTSPRNRYSHAPEYAVSEHQVDPEERARPGAVPFLFGDNYIT